MNTPRLHTLCEALTFQLVAWLGSEAAVVCTRVDGEPESLWPEERIQLGQATEKRQREFAAGRGAAREAMKQLNAAQGPIPMRPDRSPEWPEGLLGSISHTSEVCMAVVGRTQHWESIGIDLERSSEIEEPMWNLICTPQELQKILGQPVAERGQWVTRVFVAKEAFYKWHFPQWRTMLDFQDVHVEWNGDWSAFSAFLHHPMDQEKREFEGGRMQQVRDHFLACFATKALI